MLYLEVNNFVVAKLIKELKMRKVFFNIFYKPNLY